MYVFGDFGVCWPWKSDKECQIERDIATGDATTEADLAEARAVRARYAAEIAAKDKEQAEAKQEAQEIADTRVRLAKEAEDRRKENLAIKAANDAAKRAKAKGEAKLGKNKKILMVGGAILVLLAVGSFYLKDKA